MVIPDYKPKGRVPKWQMRRQAVALSVIPRPTWNEKYVTTLMVLVVLRVTTKSHFYYS